MLGYIDSFFRTPYKEELISEIIRGNVSEELIHPYIQQVKKAPFKEIIFGIFKSASESQDSNKND